MISRLQRKARGKNNKIATFKTYLKTKLLKCHTMVFSFLAAGLQLPLTSGNAAEGLRDSTAACAAKNSGGVIEPRDV